MFYSVWSDCCTLVCLTLCDFCASFHSVCFNCLYWFVLFCVTSCFVLFRLFVGLLCFNSHSLVWMWCFLQFFDCHTFFFSLETVMLCSVWCYFHVLFNLVWLSCYIQFGLIVMFCCIQIGVIFFCCWFSLVWLSCFVQFGMTVILCCIQFSVTNPALFWSDCRALFHVILVWLSCYSVWCDCHVYSVWCDFYSIWFILCFVAFIVLVVSVFNFFVTGVLIEHTFLKSNLTY